ncbi:MAG: tetratricopeptide repeat protein [Candidatus Omnitrophota bacterium]
MKAKSVFIIPACLAVILIITPWVGAYTYTNDTRTGPDDVPVFLRFLGETRSVVSAVSILQADRYFHGGIGDMNGTHAECLASAGKGSLHEEQSRDKIAPGMNPFNILFRISENIEITAHRHLSGDQVKEIIPWLYYAARIDPHNIMAYTITGFYLADKLHKVNEALDFLRNGLRNNPASWQINAEMGRIYFEHVKDHKTAIKYFSRAGKLLDKSPHDKFQERYVLSFLAYSYEAENKKDSRLLPIYKRLVTLFPNAENFRKKIKEFPANTA